MFSSPKYLESKLRSVDLTPKEIAIAKRYVEKINKKDMLVSMRRKLGLKPYPKHHVTTDENLVLIPRYKLKELEKSGRMKTDYMILEKLKKKLGLAEGGIAGQLHLNRPGYESGREVLPQQEIYEEELEKRGGFTGDPLYYFLGPGIETLKYKWPRSLLKEIIDNYRDIPEERLPEDYNTDFGKQLRKRDLSRFKKDRRPIRKKIKEQEIAKGGLAHVLGV